MERTKVARVDCLYNMFKQISRNKSGNNNLKSSLEQSTEIINEEILRYFNCDDVITFAEETFGSVYENPDVVTIYENKQRENHPDFGGRLKLRNMIQALKNDMRTLIMNNNRLTPISIAKILHGLLSPTINVSWYSNKLWGRYKQVEFSDLLELAKTLVLNYWCNRKKK